MNPMAKANLREVLEAFTNDELLTELEDRGIVVGRYVSDDELLLFKEDLIGKENNGIIIFKEKKLNG